MPLFDVTMRCTYTEIWSVYAENKTKAIRLCNDADADVQLDETGGELISWEAKSAVVANDG